MKKAFVHTLTHGDNGSYSCYNSESWSKCDIIQCSTERRWTL